MGIVANLGRRWGEERTVSGEWEQGGGLFAAACGLAWEGRHGAYECVFM